MVRVLAAGQGPQGTFRRPSGTPPQPYNQSADPYLTRESMARPRSLQLTLDDLPPEATADGPAALRVTIFNSSLDAGLKQEDIDGIECLSQKLWFIVFKKSQDMRMATDKEITVHGKTAQLKSTERPRPPKPRFIYVKLFGYPLDIDSEILSKSVGVYRELLEVRDDVDHTINIKTGIKTARFASLKEVIPSFIYAGRYHVRTAYQ